MWFIGQLFVKLGIRVSKFLDDIQPKKATVYTLHFFNFDRACLSVRHFLDENFLLQSINDSPILLAQLNLKDLVYEGFK